MLLEVVVGLLWVFQNAAGGCCRVTVGVSECCWRLLYGYCGCFRMLLEVVVGLLWVF